MWDANNDLEGHAVILSKIDVIFLGWDISSMNLADAMKRAEVLDWQLQEQLKPFMEKLKPRPSIYIPEFIAANQEDRADHILHGTKAEQVVHAHMIVVLRKT